MQTQTRPRRRGHIWLWLLVALAVGYLLLVVVLRYTNRPYRTQMALAVTMTDGVEVHGVVTRQETVIPQETSGVVGHIVDDVQRISAGTEVARIFENAAAAQSFAAAEELEKQADTLLQAQTDGANAGTDVNLILKQVSSDLYDYISVLNSGDYADLLQVRDALSYTLNKLDVAVGREESFDEQIAALQAQPLMGTAQSQAQTPVYAPQTGFFFYDVDGYEALTPEQVMALTPDDLDALQESWPRDTTAAVGKMAGSYRWYYVCAVPAAQVGRFSEGQSVTLAFTDAGVTGLKARVSHIGEPDANGRVTMAVCCEQMDERLSGLRFETAEIQIASYTGIRISKDALHINADGEIGVYIKFGTMMYFRRITPIFETDAYVLTPVQVQAEDEKNEVLLYDEVIVDGIDLYDEKPL